MSAVTTQFTLADLDRMPEDGMHREILHGELIEMPPPKPRHEIITSRINASLVGFNLQARLGTVFGSNMGYKVLRDDRTWIQPDVSFLVPERLPDDVDNDYVTGAPDLAVEVISPSESAQDVEDKTEAYLQGGAHAVIVVYPRTAKVNLVLADGTSRTLRSADTISLPNLLPGWELPVKDIFE
ncbi:MAG: Uma2 family endonuclease [Acidobacteria bacterium]|nr:Uma2 family endonuclease [Acidobacteriota bacterium]